jgi:hypothetical protein
MDGRPAVEIPLSDRYYRLVASLVRESKGLSMYEFAATERSQATHKGLVVLAYTRDYPEHDTDHIETRRLYEAVRDNLLDGVRYLYLNPALHDSQKVKGRYLFNNLRLQLQSDPKCAGCRIDDTNIRLVDAPKLELVRDLTLAFYTIPPMSGNVSDTHVVAVYRRAEGTPARFEQLSDDSVVELRMTLLDPLLKECSEIASYLLASNSEGTSTV